MSTGTEQPIWFPEVLATLLERRNLSAPQIRQVVEEMMLGRCPELETGVFLTALRMKGETAEEIAAAVEVLRAAMVRLDVGGKAVLDTCGTGGDGAATFNISTAAALVAAGAGVPVVKHGNRAVSSRSGSADVLLALGVRLSETAPMARHSLEETGLAFCFAPYFHPAMKHVAPVRQRLKTRTLFNFLGPLANPAGADFQLLGVGRPEWLDLLAGALCRLGTRHALLVCGRDGLDEVSLSGPTLVREVRAGSIRAFEWTPEDFGLSRCEVAELRVDGPEQSAALIRSLLQGAEGAPARVVVANAAAALLAAEVVANPREGVERAQAALRSGQAQRVLQRLQDLAKP